MKSERHEQALQEEINRLKSLGFKVINLEEKSPDAIAIKDGKVYAVEVLGISYYKKKRQWKGTFSIRQKRLIYHMFDGLFIKNFTRNVPVNIRKPNCETKFYPAFSKEIPSEE